jgi:acyl carrier protein
MTIEQKLREFIADEAGLADDEFNSETLLFSDGYIDSFVVTTTVTFVEEIIGTRIPQGDITLENFDSISAMLAYIEARMKGGV